MMTRSFTLRTPPWPSQLASVVLLFVAIPSLSFAQPTDLRDLLGGGSAPRQRTPKAQFTAELSAQEVAAGGELTLSITAKLPEGFYIYGTDGEFGGRTRLTVDITGGTFLDEDFVPDHAGKPGSDPVAGHAFTKFPNGVTWTRRLRVDEQAGKVSVKGKLEGQYCSSDAGGVCISILPAYKYDLTAAVLPASTPSTASSSVTTSSPKETTIRPTRRSSSEASGQKADPIVFEVRLDPPAAAPGETVTLSIKATIDDGWHTYSLTQVGEGGDATSIGVEQLQGLKPLADQFEADRPFVLKESDVGRAESFYGEVVWKRQFEVTATTPGDFGLNGYITYCVCKENFCLPANEIMFAVGAQPAGPAAIVLTGDEQATMADAESSPFGVTEEVVKAPTSPALAQLPAMEGVRMAEVTQRILDGEEPGAPDKAASAPQDKGLLPFLLLCIGGGFLALLTPCSFPMVPITVSFFLKQSEMNHRRPWLLATVYCGSIVLAFTILGVGISVFFGATKLNELANNVWVNLAIGAVFVAFGLNMLGAFEIRVPTSLLTWSAMKEGAGSYLGAVFMALTFTLTSFTCTFAVAGSLLVMAAKGDLYWPVIGMLAFGMAFASPFFVLALLPGLLRKLPKSGGWMNSVKVVMGLIEIGAAIKFFSIADFAANPQPLFLDFATTMLIWTVLSLAIASYLLGWFRLSHDSEVRTISTLRAGLAFCFLGGALLLSFLLLKPEEAKGLVMDQIMAFAPPRLHSLDTDLGPTIQHDGILFALDLNRAKTVAEQRQRPLLLDFTGVNCVNCRRMEKKMNEPANKEKLQQFVAVQLYADKVPTIVDPIQADNILQRNLDLQVNWFGDVALPSYAVVSPDGRQILAAYIGYERKEGEFTRFLDLGWKNWETQVAQQGGGRGLPQIARQ